MKDCVDCLKKHFSTYQIPESDDTDFALIVSSNVGKIDASFCFLSLQK